MSISRTALHSVSLVALSVCSLPALAQNTTAESSSATQEEFDDDLHSRGIGPDGEIVVTVEGLTQLDVLAGTNVVEGIELQRNLDGQLGEVLASLPGVSATSFSPGASRPVIRGFSGERVKVLVDGLGSLDVSNTSDDHAVSIDPLTAESIEVLRGPAVLLYGSQAIGGAVNVIDKRIPRRRVTEDFHLDALVEADTARNLWGGGASLDLPLGPNVVLHTSGSYRNTDDVEVAGFTVADSLRAEILEEAAEEEEEGEFDEADELREAAGQRGFVPNSGSETWSANGGVTIFQGDSSLGFSLGYYDTNYGVPGRPGAGHHHGEEEEEHGDEDHDEEHGEEEGEEEEIVTIDLEQFRADLRGELDLGDGFFGRMITRAGYSNYSHIEFEGDEVGTTFDTEAIEARVVLAQNRRGGYGGSWGAQYYTRNFEAVGAEAYVAPNQTDQFAVFGLQELTLRQIQLEAAARYETTNVSSRTLNIERDFDAFSGALSAIYETSANEPLRFGVTVSRAARAPSAEELFSNGPHIATQAFEIGDPNLAVEKSVGVEGFVRGRLGAANITFSVFQNWFDNYIYLSETGAEEDELPVFVYLQQDADYFGIEGSIDFPLADLGSFALYGDVRGEYVRAELDDGTNVPRIPPLSLLGAIEARSQQFDARVEVEWFDDQNNVASFESATDGFTHVNASIGFEPFAGDDTVRLLVQAKNIFDAEGRRHTSFTKDFVPLAGRNFRVSLLASF
ncbi:TonB-dependent receptor [Qipengyuania sp. DSG2-2]|uniref:TonB-dependent receptor n=1 Tax=Qipengyuania sp. DGS2-2 TaxID=3349631 RepID=UPI0036D378BA